MTRKTHTLVEAWIRAVQDQDKITRAWLATEAGTPAGDVSFWDRNAAVQRAKEALRVLTNHILSEQ